MEDIGITSLSEVRTRDEFDGDERDGEKRQKIEVEEVISVPKQENGGGILDNLLAKLSSPRATSHPTVDAHDLEAGTDGGDDASGEGGGGEVSGVFNNIISSFFHRGGESENVENGDEEKKDDKVEGEKIGNKDLVKENEDSKTNGGSIISNLVPDDVAPASDEASILIHSVVHD